jgi:hypothetical protein
VLTALPLGQTPTQQPTSETFYELFNIEANFMLSMLPLLLAI